ncbi:MAG: alpha-amylase [Atopobiaceae bacterium]|nr:alpha-amylase [Atopobiaceae bacterium]
MNATLLQGFSWYLPDDGTHWSRLAEKATDMAGKGITAVWLPPAYKGAAGGSDVGYGVYDLYDLGEFDQKGSVRTKYGTRDEYLRCIEALHGAGLRVMADVVLNHRMGADACEWVRAVEVDPQDRRRAITDEREVEVWTKFTFPGRKGAYSDFAWDWHCFHGVDYNAAKDEHAIFLFEGKQWDQNVTSSLGNYDYLMGCDVDLMYQPVYDELLRWGVWYVRTTGVDSLRLDAVKHMERTFYLRWLNDVQEQVGRELFAVGEYWESGLGELEGYLGPERVMSLFDVFLHFRLHDASCSDGEFDLAKIFDGTLVQADPVHAVTFVDNHDTQTGQSLQSSVAAWFKPMAYALILLREAGYPCVFYGDLYGSPRVNAVPLLPELIKIRQLLAYGRQRDWLDAPDVIGWTREGCEDEPGSGCAVVISDRAEGRKRMCVGAVHAGETWRCVVGEQPSVVIDGDGWADFDVAPAGLSVYVSERGALALA